MAPPMTPELQLSQIQAILGGISKQPGSDKPFSELVTEYLAHGDAHGGIGGRPWSKEHKRITRLYMEYWQRHLHAQTVGDLMDGSLVQEVERIADEYAQKRAPNSVKHLVVALRSLIHWAEKRGYITSDPLKALGCYSGATKKTRRELTREEIGRLLKAAPEYRRILYELALASGLRANELRQLTIQDLDTDRSLIHVRADVAKSRKEAWQPIPSELCARLKDYAGQAAAVCDKLRAVRSSDILVYVPPKPAEAFKVDAKRAGIELKTARGVVDFHALRTTFDNMVIRSGANPTESMKLLRHSTAEMTFRVYGRAQDSRLSEISEAVGRMLTGEDVDSKTTSSDASLQAVIISWSTLSRLTKEQIVNMCAEEVASVG